MSRPIDLGSGHVLNPYTRNDVEGIAGYVDSHPYKGRPGQTCGGSVPITPDPDRPAGPVWQVVSEDPLTLSPSLLCTMCGDHGWVRDGVWVDA